MNHGVMTLSHVYFVLSSEDQAFFYFCASTNIRLSIFTLNDCFDLIIPSLYSMDCFINLLRCQYFRLLFPYFFCTHSITIDNFPFNLFLTITKNSTRLSLFNTLVASWIDFSRFLLDVAIYLKLSLTKKAMFKCFWKIDITNKHTYQIQNTRTPSPHLPILPSKQRLK